MGRLGGNTDCLWLSPMLMNSIWLTKYNMFISLYNAIVARGFLSLSYASNRHASPRHREIEQNVNACIEIFSRCFVVQNHRRYIANSAEQSTTPSIQNNTKHSVRYTKVKNVADTSAMFPTWSCKHRRCIFDVIISPMMAWVIHRRCSRTVLRSIGDASLRVRNVINLFFYIFTFHPIIRQRNESDLFFIDDLIRQPQGMWFDVKSLQPLYAIHKVLCHRHDCRNFGDTSPNRPIPRKFINASCVCFLVGPHVRYRHWSSPHYVFLVASTWPDISYGSRGTIAWTAES